MDLIETMDARGVATRTLNRPDRHDAFDSTLVAGMVAFLSKRSPARRPMGQA